jgi:hypothetical protein
MSQGDTCCSNASQRMGVESNSVDESGKPGHASKQASIEVASAHGRHSGRERQPKHRVDLALPAAVVAR